MRTGLGSHNNQPNARGDVDEFDMLAQSRNNSVGAAPPGVAAQLAALPTDVNAVSSISALPVLVASSATNTPKKEAVSLKWSECNISSFLCLDLL